MGVRGWRVEVYNARFFAGSVPSSRYSTMVVIRLARGGAKKRPFFNIVVADSRLRRDGRFIERVGFYNPVASGAEQPLRVAFDRVEHWTGARRADVADGRAPGRAGEEPPPESRAPGVARRRGPRSVDAGWPDDALEVGRIGDAWGVKGWFKVLPLSPIRPRRCSRRRAGTCKPPEGRAGRPAGAAAVAATLEIASVRASGDGSSRSSPASPTAPPPRRCAARASSSPRSQFPEPAADEFYWADLIGLDVVNREGVALGSVVGLLDTGPHSVLRVAAARRADARGSADPVRLRLRRQRRPAGAPHRRRLGPRLLSAAAGTMRFDVITLFPGAVLGAPRPRRHPARLRAGPGRRPPLAAARLRRSAASRASTTARTAAARGW